MLLKSKHNYHLVDINPWPILTALAAMVLVTGLTKWFHLNSMNLLITGIILIMIMTMQWWRDVTREGTFQGVHSIPVMDGLRWGMILFITSEILFFLSFFWAFFHSSLSPTPEIGLLWPPLGISPFNPMKVPMLNTMILLASGVTITWSHHSITENNLYQATQSLFLTVTLGIYFSSLQWIEYLEASFTISDSSYGATFYTATGFHGLHVIIGTSFLTVMLARMKSGHLSKIHHVGFEAAAWYWHFVDVVWLFLYLTIYWWGS